MKKIPQKPLRVVASVDPVSTYTTVEASRLVTASMRVLQDLASSGELVASKSGQTWIITGQSLLDFAKKDAEARQARKEQARLRKAKRKRADRKEERQSKQQEQLPLAAKKEDTKPFVLIRSRDAGVHCGTLESADRDVVTLSSCRRVWRWGGANTLNELSLRGADQAYTRISEPVDRLTIIGACEIIPCTTEARQNLSISRWGA